MTSKLKQTFPYGSGAESRCSQDIGDHLWELKIYGKSSSRVVKLDPMAHAYKPNNSEVETGRAS